MRIAVFSDVHGFNLALERVIAGIEAQGPFDEIIAAGDHCELGPGPAESLDLLIACGYTLLIGNTDQAIVDAAWLGTGDNELRFSIEQLGVDRIKTLAKLPFSRRITPPGGKGPDDDLLVVHATPHSLVDRFDPDATDEELRAVIGPTQAAAIAFGHVHICYTRQVDRTLLVDVSAVGNSKNGDLSSKYGILNWDAAERSWHAEIRTVDYPLAETEAQIRQNGVPNAEKVVKRLRRATYRSTD
ncbi:hypothetical protein BH23CHL5_BH23CHL5_21080 [soil metagenome]